MGPPRRAANPRGAVSPARFDSTAGAGPTVRSRLVPRGRRASSAGGGAAAGGEPDPAGADRRLLRRHTLPAGRWPHQRAVAELLVQPLRGPWLSLSDRAAAPGMEQPVDRGLVPAKPAVLRRGGVVPALLLGRGEGV